MQRPESSLPIPAPGLPAALAGTLLLLLVSLPGCLSTQTGSPVAESLDSLGVSIRGIRESNIRLAYSDGLTIEQAADSIVKLAGDQQTKAHALLWKIYCIPVIRQIYGQSDPLLSTTDALASSMQCSGYFSSGLGKDRFGVLQQIAIDAVGANERRLVELHRVRRFTQAVPPCDPRG